MDNEYVTADGKIICQLCKKPFSKITASHLSSKHDGMTTEKYIELFPGAPVSNEAFKLSKSIAQKFDTFKKNEEVLKDTAKVPEVNVKRVLYQKPQPTTKLVSGEVKDVDYGPHVHKNKVLILKFLSKYYPALINNYAIELYTPDGHLEYRFQTDMADPVSKTVFEFPGVIWHNVDPRPNLTRNTVLKENGWKVIVTDSPAPNPEDLKPKLDIITESN